MVFLKQNGRLTHGKTENSYRLGKSAGVAVLVEDIIGTWLRDAGNANSTWGEAQGTTKIGWDFDGRKLTHLKLRDFKENPWKHGLNTSRRGGVPSLNHWPRLMVFSPFFCQRKSNWLMVSLPLLKKNSWLVVLTILKNTSSSMGRMTSHIWNGKKNVPNHQPESHWGSSCQIFIQRTIFATTNWLLIGSVPLYPIAWAFFQKCVIIQYIHYNGIWYLIIIQKYSIIVYIYITVYIMVYGIIILQCVYI